MALLTRHPGSKKYRGPSPGLWKKFDSLMAADPFYGYGYQSDFASVSSGTANPSVADWRVASIVGTATFGPPATTTASTVFGTAILDTGAATATHGGQAQLNGGGILPAAGRGIYYETLVRFTNLGTVSSNFAQGFVGLAAPTAGTVMSTVNLNVNGIGYSLAATGELTFQLKGSGGVLSKLTGVIAAVSTWYHLGFAVNPDTGVCNAWVNSVKDNLATSVTTKAFTKAEVDTIVTTPVTPTYHILNATGGALRTTMEVDWVRSFMTDPGFEVR